MDRFVDVFFVCLVGTVASIEYNTITYILLLPMPRNCIELLFDLITRLGRSFEQMGYKVKKLQRKELQSN